MTMTTPQYLAPSILAAAALLAVPAHAQDSFESQVYQDYVAANVGGSGILLADGYGPDTSAGSVLGEATTTIGVDVATSGVEADASVEADATISLTRDDATDTETLVESTAAVETSSDLRAYASGVLQSDTRIERADLSAEAVTVEYEQPGRLFGFVPVAVTVTATVDSSGNVTVDYPWYGFMVALEQSEREVESSLENQIRTTLASGGFEASAEAGLSAQAQAEILRELQASLAATVEGGAGTE